MLLTQTAHPGIAKLDEHLLDAAAHTLSKALHTAPLYQWIFPDPAQRSVALGHLLRVPLTYGFKHGQVTQTHAAKAVAVWMPPGRSVSPGPWMCAGARALALPLRLGWEPWGRFFEAMKVMGAIHQRRMREPHWYLMFLGVDHELQGQGRGTALVMAGLEQADRQGHPCYLVTSEGHNLGFYERLGFHVVESTCLGRQGPETWTLLR